MLRTAYAFSEIPGKPGLKQQMPRIDQLDQDTFLAAPSYKASITR